MNTILKLLEEVHVACSFRHFFFLLVFGKICCISDSAHYINKENMDTERETQAKEESEEGTKHE